MRFDIKRALVTNWPMKVTALAAATVLWAAVTAQETTTQQVPVTLTVQPPPGRALTQEPPEVYAVFTGPVREIFKLYSNPPAIAKVVPNVGASTYTIDLSTQDLVFETDAAATAQDVRPRQVEIFLDSVDQKVVPIRSRVTVRPDSGYELVGTPTMQPGSVTVTGPADMIADVQRIATRPMTISELRAPFRQQVTLDTAGLGAVTVSPSVVDLVGEVAEVTTRVLAAVPVEIRAPAGERWQTETATVLVTIRGPSVRITRLTVDSVTVTAAPPATADSAVVRLIVTVPRGIGGRATPDSVMVRRSDRA